METTSFTRTETCLDTKTIVTTDTQDNKTTTTTQTDNKTTTNTASGTHPNPAIIRCPCHKLDLCKLLEETRRQAFRSTNISAATSNGILIFALKILQQILIHLCKKEEVDINQIFLVATAIAEIAEIIRVYNPAPFNS